MHNEVYLADETCFLAASLTGDTQCKTLCIIAFILFSYHGTMRMVGHRLEVTRMAHSMSNLRKWVIWALQIQLTSKTKNSCLGHGTVIWLIGNSDNQDLDNHHSGVQKIVQLFMHAGNMHQIYQIVLYCKQNRYQTQTGLYLLGAQWLTMYT